jgi:imidazolonepropionase-like amidohydrolase
MRRAGAALALTTLLAAMAAPAATLVHAGRVIDGVSDTVRTNQTVVVENGRITAIESGYRQPAPGDRVIDLKQGTLMPGWFDMHVHITGEYSRTSEIDSYKKNEGDVVDGARPRRFVSRGHLAAQRDQRRQGAGSAHRRGGQVHREYGRPRRSHEWLGAQVSRRPGAR